MNIANCPSVTRFDSRLTRFVARGESKSIQFRFGGMWSSVIRGAWYLPQRRQLDLLFASGRRYIYSGVPMALAQGFARADSKGRFYNAEIRNSYPCREIGQEQILERRAA